MRCACIDIGSNTTRLLVAQPSASGTGLDELAAHRAFTHLGRDRGPDGSLDAAKLAGVLVAVQHQLGLAWEAGAEVVALVATAAVREAPNGDALREVIRAATGLEVDVVAGEEEARLAFVGAVGCEPGLGRDEVVGVVDVGGASTEVVCGTAAGGVAWARSFAVGSSTLTERHVHSACPTLAELEAARAEVLDALRGRLPDAPRPGRAFAAGGSATSLHRFTGGRLDADGLARSLAALCRGTAATVAAQTGLHEDRVRMLPAGIVVLDVTRRALGVELHVGHGGLREGVLLELLQRG